MKLWNKFQKKKRVDPDRVVNDLKSTTVVHDRYEGQDRWQRREQLMYWNINDINVDVCTKYKQQLPCEKIFHKNEL